MLLTPIPALAPESSPLDLERFGAVAVVIWLVVMLIVAICVAGLGAGVGAGIDDMLKSEAGVGAMVTELLIVDVVVTAVVVTHVDGRRFGSWSPKMNREPKVFIFLKLRSKWHSIGRFQPSKSRLMKEIGLVPFVVTFVLNASGKDFLLVDVFTQIVFDESRDMTYVR